MKVCVAQTRPVTGDIKQNIARHKVFVATAVSHQASLIIFPELSLTGYEPTLAQALAIQPNDSRLDVFQTIADAGEIVIGVGAPTQNEPRPCISLIIFRPHQPRQVYSKQFLHEDEEPFFVGGEQVSGLIGDKNEAALAICYELSVPEHAFAASSNGAKIYIASVAKFAKGVAQANERLAEIARQHSMTVFMANAVGLADGGECAGGTAVWHVNGQRAGQLDNTHEGVLIFDTNTQELTEKII